MPAPLPRGLRDSRYDIPRVISGATAREWGMTRSGIEHAIAVGHWRRLFRDVLLTVPEEPTRPDWINAGLEVAGPGALSGWDAARVAGLGDGAPPSDFVLVLAKSGRHRRLGNVWIRPTDRPFSSWTVPVDHPDLALVPVVPTARAVADTALLYRRLAPVRALVTSAVQRRKCTTEELVDELARMPRNGSAHFRTAVDDVVGGARSIAEAEAIRWLARASVPAFGACRSFQLPGGDASVARRPRCTWSGRPASEPLDQQFFGLSGAA